MATPDFHILYDGYHFERVDTGDGPCVEGVVYDDPELNQLDPGEVNESIIIN